MLMALTLHPRWGTAVSLADPKKLGPDVGKTIENRTWLPPASLVGKHIAIHAGRHGESLDDARNVWRMLYGQDAPLSSWEAWIATLTNNAGKVLAVARIAGSQKVRKGLTPNQLRWKQEGQIGWVLDDVRALPRPMLQRGLMGLWMLPRDVEKEIRAQVGL